jgi:hypothetical protein
VATTVKPVADSKLIALANRRFHIALGLSVALAISLGHSQAASAQVAVALTKLKGPSKKVQKQVDSLLSKDFLVVTPSEYEQVAKKIGAVKLNPTNIAKVANQLEVGAVVSGTVKRVRRKRFRVTIILRYGPTGELISKSTFAGLRKPSLLPKNKKQLRKKLRKGLAEVEERLANEPPPEEAVEGTDAGEDDSSAFDSGDDKERPDEEEEDSAPTESVLSPLQRADKEARGRAIEVTLGMSLSSRSLSFNYDAEKPQGYSGFPFGGVLLSAELYPMAFNKNKTGALTNIGVSVTLDKLLFVKSALEGMEDTELGTTHLGFGFGLVYRWNIGTGPTKPTLKFGVGFNKLNFTINEDDAPVGVVVDIPDVSYTYVDPGVGIRFPFSKKLAVNASAKFLAVFSAGNMQDMDQYGASTITGGSFDLGLDFKLTSDIFLRGGGRVTTLGYSFDGDGLLTDTNADGTQDVGGARDTYFSGYAGAGYLF